MLSDRDRKMSDQVVNWGEEIGVIAGAYRPTDTKDSWLGRAYKEVAKINPKVSFRHFTDLFYGRIPDPKYSVAFSVLTAADRARMEEANRDAKRDAQVVARFFNSHAQALASIDPEANRSEINAFVEAARIVSSRNSA